MQRQGYNFKNAPYNLINLEISSINWHDLLDEPDLDKSLQKFYDSIFKVIDLYVPKHIKKSNRFPVYFRPVTIRAVKEKNKLHKRWKMFKDPDSYNMYRIVRSESKRLINQDYRNFVNNTQHNITANHREFWKFISQKKIAIPPILFQWSSMEKLWKVVSKYVLFLRNSSQVLTFHLVLQ